MRSNPTKLDELKKVIQIANPEIMELKFGCEVRAWWGEDCLIFTILQESVVCRKHKIWKEECYGEDNTDETFLVVELSDDGAFTTNLLKEKSDSKIFRPFIDEILGRPIRLADVLLAASLIKDLRTLEVCADIVSNWNLKDDNLDHQSEETINFLWELLCKE